MKNLSKKSLSYILCTVLFAAVTLNIGCGKTASSAISDTDTITTEVQTINEADAKAETEVSVTESVEVQDEDNVPVNETGMEILKGCELGEGETQFTFEVTGHEGTTEVFTINTDEKTVGAALLSVGIIAGDESEYGLYVKVVNGELADWDVDKKYWAFYIDGDYAMTGVDSTEVVAGSTYSFKVE